MKRTTHRSSRGTKLYAVRDKKGFFKDIQTYKRAHSADLRARGTRGDRAAAKRIREFGGIHEKTTIRWFGWHRGNVLTPGSLVGAGWLTARQCAEAMEAAYGYLRERPDLTGPPHFWNIPKPVRCRVVVTTLKPVTGIVKR